MIRRGSVKKEHCDDHPHANAKDRRDRHADY
jgi:hypothetical protein